MYIICYGGLLEKMFENWKNYTYLFTILFFVLGFFNILFAWLGFACLTIPFILLLKDRKKTWCQSYCPRVNLFENAFKGRSLTGRGGPAWLVKGKGKWYVLGYFFFNLFILTMSTIMVSLGKMPPMEMVRFMIVFPLPWEMPQLLEFAAVQDWAVHLSFRLYSMMFTTSVIGILLAWLYKPRTWCTICPVNTMSDMMLKK